MSIHYSAAMRGFFDPEIHVSMPEDAVPITKKEHADLLAAQSAGQLIEPDAAGRPVAVPPPPPSDAEIQAQLTAVVQRHLDAKAKALGYDNIFTAVTYAEEPSVPKFQADGLALRAWRSAVWAAGYALLADVQAGQAQVPSAEALVDSLPAFVL